MLALPVCGVKQEVWPAKSGSTRPISIILFCSMSDTLFGFILVHFKSLKSCQLTVADNNVYPQLHTMQVISCNSNYQRLAATLCHLAQTPHNVLLQQNNPINMHICHMQHYYDYDMLYSLVFTGNCWSIFLLMYGTLYEKKIHSIHQTQKNIFTK